MCLEKWIRILTESDKSDRIRIKLLNILSERILIKI